ncbi:MAG: hypothetical protein ACT4QF_18875 [Sporichthyaceae bacterium]|jgi:hypothetical protein
MKSRAERRHLGKRTWFTTPAVMVPIVAIGVVTAGGAYAFVRPAPATAPIVGKVQPGGFVITTIGVTPTGKVLGPGRKGDLSITFAVSTLPYEVTAIAQDTGRPVAVSGGGSGCNGASVTLAAIGVPGVEVTTTTGPVTKRYRNVVAMAVDAASGCQGATFAIPVLLTGRSL